MLKLIYATKNPAKVMAMQARLQKLPIQIDSLPNISGKLPDVVEDGDTPLANARKKALAYYEALRQPVFSCDSGLYFEGDASAEQPGIHVRTIGGTYLTDDEMIEHYTGLVKRYGQIKAHYKNAICLILDENHIYEAMDPDMESQPFLITDRPHEMRKNGFPLDSISLEIESGRYYYDIAREDLDVLAVEEGFLRFFTEILNE